jgi:signal transduction histidine kinase
MSDHNAAATIPSPESCADEEPVYSNRFIQAQYRHITKNYGTDIAERIFSTAGVEYSAFSNPNGFAPASVLNAIVMTGISITGREDFNYRAGLAVPDDASFFANFAIRAGSVSNSVRLMAAFESRLARKTEVRVEKLSRDRYRLTARLKDGFREIPQACQNRRGTYESVPRFFGLPNAKVDHPRCFHRGEGDCEYVLTLPPSGFRHYLWLAAGFYGTALCAAAAAATLAHPGIGLAAVAAALAGGIAHVSSHLRRLATTVGWYRDKAQKLDAEVEQLVEKNDHLAALQKISQGLGAAGDRNALARLIVESVKQRFDFPLVQLWLVNDDATSLRCAACRADSPRNALDFENLSYPLARGRDISLEAIRQIVVPQGVVEVDITKPSTGRLPSITRHFLREHELSHPVMVPIADEREIYGLLLLESCDGSRLSLEQKLAIHAVAVVAAETMGKSLYLNKLQKNLDEQNRQLISTSAQLDQTKALAIQQDKLSMLGTMAAGVAHDLKNPLNFLLNMLPDVETDIHSLIHARRLALDSGGELARKIQGIGKEHDLEGHIEEMDWVMTSMKKAVEKSLRLANNFRVASRRSTGERRVENLAALVEDTLGLIPQKMKCAFNVQIDVDPSIHCQLERNEIDQTLLNIIGNAFDAMGDSGRLSITGVRNEKEAVLSVSDTGPGIPQGIIEKIFTPFFTTKPPEKGTGLGLALCREMVEKNGGRIEVHSTAGQGATFLLTFPCAEQTLAGTK